MAYCVGYIELALCYVNTHCAYNVPYFFVRLPKLYVGDNFRKISCGLSTCWSGLSIQTLKTLAAVSFSAGNGSQSTRIEYCKFQTVSSAGWFRNIFYRKNRFGYRKCAYWSLLSQFIYVMWLRITCVWLVLMCSFLWDGSAPDEGFVLPNQLVYCSVHLSHNLR